jgi:hypothetical protein
VSELDSASFKTCFTGRRQIKYGYPPLAEGEYSWYGVQRKSEWIFSPIMQAVGNCGLWLESIETPLLGNRASYCAVSQHDFFRSFPSTVTRVAITITRVWPQRDIFDTYLRVLHDLAYLEITMSRSPADHFDGDGPLCAPHRLSSATEPGGFAKHYRLFKLKEFRLMSDHQYTFFEHEIFLALTYFPNLEKVAFGHIVLAEGDRSTLLQRLAALNLERLWLLDPYNLILNSPHELVGKAGWEQVTLNTTWRNIGKISI